MQHRANVFGRGYSDRDNDPPRMRFVRAIASSLITIVAPGAAQAFLGNRLVGRLALTFHALLIATAVFAVWTFRNDRARAIGWLVSPEIAFWVSIVLVVGAVVWLGLFIDAWRIAHTDLLPTIRRGIVTAFNLTIIMTVVIGIALTTRLLSVQRDVVTEVFTATKTSSPLNGRYNILLIGSDSGAGRVGMRPDSLNVVSIDASSGKAVIVSVPRNLEDAQFPADSPMHDIWPYGFNCGSECLINAVYTDAVSREGLYPGAEDPGLEATIDAVEGSTGLKINYHVLVNLQGFSSLVDAVGGVEVDVKKRIAKFGHEDAWRNQWIEPGKQVLNGKDALWYARSRYGSDDFLRSARQKCLMVAMLDQLDPRTVLLNASAIGKSSKKLFATNIPQSELGAFGDLALTAKSQKIATFALVPPQVDVANPDFAAIKRAIQQTIARSEATATPKPSSSPSPSTARNPTNPGEQGEPVEANRTDDLAAAC